jgi:Major Facilitator Superfamily
MLGLIVYGIGAVLSAVSPGLGVLILGNSILEGVGTAMLIPPAYILTTLLFTELTSRARAFGVISAMGGIGAAAGPLIGGLITSAISWRAAFIFQALVIAVIVVLSRKITDPLPADPTRPFDTTGAILSAVGLVLVVTGILAADNNLWAHADLDHRRCSRPGVVLPLDTGQRAGRQWFLPCRHPSRPCPIEPPPSHRARNNPQAAQLGHTCGEPCTSGIPRGGSPCWRSSNSDPRYGGGDRGCPS